MNRVGFGFDVHPLVSGRPLVLGGVTVESDLGLLGHSDADVLAHAIGEALLGALALGDLGRDYPDSDERWRGADSIALLREVVAMLAGEGLEIEHVDCTVLIEEPKLAPHRLAIRASLAGALGVDVGRVNVKATTGERMGFVGRGEGVGALAVASLTGAADR